MEHLCLRLSQKIASSPPMCMHSPVAALEAEELHVSHFIVAHLVDVTCSSRAELDPTRVVFTLEVREDLLQTNRKPRVIKPETTCYQTNRKPRVIKVIKQTETHVLSKRKLLLSNKPEITVIKHNQKPRVTFSKHGRKKNMKQKRIPAGCIPPTFLVPGEGSAQPPCRQIPWVC